MQIINWQTGKLSDKTLLEVNLLAIVCLAYYFVTVTSNIIEDDQSETYLIIIHKVNYPLGNLNVNTDHDTEI